MNSILSRKFILIYYTVNQYYPIVKKMGNKALKGKKKSSDDGNERKPLIRNLFNKNSNRSMYVDDVSIATDNSEVEIEVEIATYRERLLIWSEIESEELPFLYYPHPTFKEPFRSWAKGTFLKPLFERSKYWDTLVELGGNYFFSKLINSNSNTVFYTIYVFNYLTSC